VGLNYSPILVRESSVETETHPHERGCLQEWNSPHSRFRNRKEISEPAPVDRRFVELLSLTLPNFDLPLHQSVAFARRPLKFRALDNSYIPARVGDQSGSL
jgi:hypothetical protein